MYATISLPSPALEKTSVRWRKKNVQVNYLRTVSISFYNYLKHSIMSWAAEYIPQVLGWVTENS